MLPTDQTSHRPADWQLPDGVNRGLWDYLHSAAIACTYDATLAGTALFAVDEAFVARHCPASARVLDLGCGTGRLLLGMAARGHRVVGVDLSADMLAVAGEKAATAGVAVDLLQGNITDLRFLAAGSFDCVSCLFSTLGMVVGKPQRRRVVAEAHRLLRSGGKFVLHVHNRWFNCRTPAGRRWLWHNFCAGLTGTEEPGDRTMPVHQGIAGLTLHLFTRHEAVRLLREAGFRDVAVVPVSLQRDGILRWPWFLGWARAYGYLLAAEK